MGICGCEGCETLYIRHIPTGFFLSWHIGESQHHQSLTASHCSKVTGHKQPHLENALVPHFYSRQRIAVGSYPVIGPDSLLCTPIAHVLLTALKRAEAMANNRIISHQITAEHRTRQDKAIALCNVLLITSHDSSTRPRRCPAGAASVRETVGEGVPANSRLSRHSYCRRASLQLDIRRRPSLSLCLKT